MRMRMRIRKQNRMRMILCTTHTKIFAYAYGLRMRIGEKQNPQMSNFGDRSNPDAVVDVFLNWPNHSSNYQGSISAVALPHGFNIIVTGITYAVR